MARGTGGAGLSVVVARYGIFGWGWDVWVGDGFMGVNVLCASSFDHRSCRMMDVAPLPTGCSCHER